MPTDRPTITLEEAEERALAAANAVIDQLVESSQAHLHLFCKDDLELEFELQKAKELPNNSNFRESLVSSFIASLAKNYVIVPPQPLQYADDNQVEDTLLEVVIDLSELISKTYGSEYKAASESVRDAISQVTGYIRETHGDQATALVDIAIASFYEAEKSVSAVDEIYYKTIRFYEAALMAYIELDERFKRNPSDNWLKISEYIRSFKPEVAKLAYNAASSIYQIAIDINPYNQIAMSHVDVIQKTLDNWD